MTAEVWAMTFLIVAGVAGIVVIEVAQLTRQRELALWVSLVAMLFTGLAVGVVIGANAP